MRSKAVQRDGNEATIIAAVRSLGWLVQPLSGSGVPDLLCWTGARLVLVEVKDGAKPACHRRLSAAQVEWHREWGGAGAPVFVVTSVAEVEALGRHEAGR